MKRRGIFFIPAAAVILLWACASAPNESSESTALPSEKTGKQQAEIQEEGEGKKTPFAVPLPEFPETVRKLEGLTEVQNGFAGFVRFSEGFADTIEADGVRASYEELQEFRGAATAWQDRLNSLEVKPVYEGGIDDDTYEAFRQEMNAYSARMQMVTKRINRELEAARNE